jgi:hypothetical protein
MHSGQDTDGLERGEAARGLLTEPMKGTEVKSTGRNRLDPRLLS